MPTSPSPRLQEKAEEQSLSGVSLRSVTAFLALLDWDGSPVTLDLSLARHGMRSRRVGRANLPPPPPKEPHPPFLPRGRLEQGRRRSSCLLPLGPRESPRRPPHPSAALPLDTG
ncbi:unnamed protein product [Rangifer tarandus platyrhynchus]|uniref:Uncharacterized protein n=1 Tax=Rangifer tarandus platyrhynchus TaxID=3082113 RepID=A0AC59ZUZ4_RANTA